MAVEKIVSITGDNLDQSVKLMFAIAPPTVDFLGIFPVVLKVFSLKGTDTITWKWTDVTIACRVEITSHSGACTCDVYQVIPAGQTSKLELRGVSGYSISTPTSYPGTNARMVNSSGRIVDLGSGFVNDFQTMDETAYPVLVYRHVANTIAAYINYTPILKVWATADYEEGQLLDSDISALPELWSGDLSVMMGPEVPLIVSRDNISGKITMFLKGSAPNPDTPRSQHQTVFKADLAFATPELVTDGVHAISKLLLNKGYTIKTFSKAGSNTEIHIDLTLPQTVNCNEAELHMLAALQASPTVHGKVFVKGRSGVTLLTASPGLESWAEINPASPRWFGI